LRQWTPSTTAIRWRTRKPNIQRPIPDHYVKAKYLAALAPIYPEPLANVPWYDACGNLLKNKKTEAEEHPYEKLLANKVYNHFAESQVIAVLHENPTKAYEKMQVMNIKTLQRFVNYLNFLQIRHLLDGHDMRFVYANKNIIKMALAGTEFEPMLRLHVGSTCYLCCKNLEVTKLLKLLKKMPTHILLGAMVQGRLLTRSEVAWCSTLPDISILRAELCSILSSSSSNLSQNLMHHQLNLSQSLASLASSTSSNSSDSDSDSGSSSDSDSGSDSDSDSETKEKK